MAAQSEARDERQGDTGTNVAAAGGIIGALAMTSCCILPLALFSLGATGAWIGRMAALYQYKWLILAFSGAALAYGFYKVYWQAPRACAGANCAHPLSHRIVKSSLWAATVIVAASLLFPYVTPSMLGY